MASTTASRMPSALQVAVADSGGAAILDAAHLHPHQVVGVIDHAHLVGLGVAHPEPGFHMLQRRLAYGGIDIEALF